MKVIFFIVITIMTVVSAFFHKNVAQVKEPPQYIAEFNKFNMYFLEETKKAENGVESEFEKESNQIIFSNGITFSYVPSEKAVYRDNRKICENVERCVFTPKHSEEKAIVEVSLIIGNSDEFNRTITYVVNK